MPEVGTLTMDPTTEVQARWDRLRSSLDANSAAFQERPSQPSTGLSALFDKWWHEIEAEYGSPARRYHSLTHLQQMLRELEGHREQIRDMDKLELATFFHDLIYNPRSGRNEEDSADRFSAFAVEMGMAEGLRDGVVRCILATKQHQADSESESDGDLALFLDTDMSILGQPRPAYLRYAWGVRQEYQHVPRATYLQKRAEVLSSFLSQPRIYASDSFHARLEAAARENIAHEIALLNSGHIPLEEEAGALATEST